MDPVSFRKFLAVLKRQWWVILQAMLVVGLAAGWQASRVPEEPYQASASVLVRAAPDDGDISLAYGDPTSYVKAQLRILKGPAVTAAVAARLPGVPADELTQIEGSTEEYSSTFTVTATNYFPDRAMAGNFHMPDPTTPSMQAWAVWAVPRSLATTRRIFSFPPGT